MLALEAFITVSDMQQVLHWCFENVSKVIIMLVYNGRCATVICHYESSREEGKDILCECVQHVL